MENVRYMISDAANIVNVESHVLRYWEEELELAIPRNEMGHRYYTEENIAQFQKIKEWKEQGYQLKAIRMMIHNSQQSNGYPSMGSGEFQGSQASNGHSSMGSGEFQGSQASNGYSSMGGGEYQGSQTANSHLAMGNGEYQGSQQSNGYPSMGAEEFHRNRQAGELQTGGNNVIQMNREYPETMSRPMAEKHNHPLSNTVKLEQFQSMMLTIVKQAMEENNPELGKEVGVQVGERVLKEMNYLMREQDEAEEERFRKLDAAIRATRKSKRFRREKKEKKETGKILGKDKKLSPNLTVVE